jgi:hypothetical protein
MTARSFGLFAALVALGMSAQPSSAQGVAGTIQAWGLPGTWAVSCRAGLSARNPRETITIDRFGGAVLHRDFGNVRDSNRILGAWVDARGALVVRVRFTTVAPQETREWAMVKSADGRRRRAVYNRNVANNSFSIRNGIVTASGARSAWLRRCR